MAQTIAASIMFIGTALFFVGGTIAMFVFFGLRAVVNRLDAIDERLEVGSASIEKRLVGIKQ
jgi:hypothetical protein